MSHQPPKEIRAALRILDQAILQLQRSRDDIVQAWVETLQPTEEKVPKKKGRKRGGLTVRPSNDHPWRNRRINTTVHENEKDPGKEP